MKGNPVTFKECFQVIFQIVYCHGPEEKELSPSLLTHSFSVEPTIEKHTRTLEWCFGSHSTCDGSVTLPDSIFA